MDKVLKAPGTARIGPVEVVKAEPPWYQVTMSVDAQNSFGAFIRQRYCCTFRLDTGDTFNSHPIYGACSLDRQRGNAEADEVVLELCREMSGWGKPPKE